MPFRRAAVSALLAALTCVGRLGAQDAGYDSTTHRWTLRSGVVIYRLAARGDDLLLDYFGPSSRDTSWIGPAPELWRRDLSGSADGFSIEPPALRLVSQAIEHTPGAAVLVLTLRHRQTPLEVEARYAAWGSSGVITRDVTLRNRGQRAIHVEAAPTLTLALPRGEYQLRYLYGSWGQERQLAQEKLGAGARSFEQTNGRSTNGYVPWLSLRNESSGVEYMTDLAWSGNWQMRVERAPGTGSTTLADRDVSVTMGLRADFGGSMTLSPGDSLPLPRVAITASTSGLDGAANQLHRYQRQYVMPQSTLNRPLLVQFNSWFAFGPGVSSTRLAPSIDAAAALGAEAYILDSGWFSSGNWEHELGDYQVDGSKFPDGLTRVAERVRQRGMKFGLWVEIENVGRSSAIFRDHADWCLSYRGAPIVTQERCQLDFGRPEVRAWARATIDRLVAAYGVSWLKIDYNIDIGERFDPADSSRVGRRLRDHIAGYYAWLDDLRAAHPDLLIENCASGGLRFDSGVLAHTHTTWLSDFVDPRASLSLAYGCTLQFPAEVCNHWMVGDTDSGTVNTRAPAGWWDFMFRVPMNGQFGLSSRLGEWNAPLKARAASNIALYKRIRRVIAGADVYHLTAQPARVGPRAWMALQYVTPDSLHSVVTAYRLKAGAPRRRFALRGLDRDARYDLTVNGVRRGSATGASLVRDGLPVALGAEWRAAIIELNARDSGR